MVESSQGQSEVPQDRTAGAQFRATMSNAKLFRNLLGAISSLIEEANFSATPDGIKLRSLDPSHIAMVDFELPKGSFDTYECKAPLKMRFGLANPLRLLKRAGNDESIEVIYDGLTKKLKIVLKGMITRRFTVPTFDPSDEESPNPVLSTSARVKMIASNLRDIIEDARASSSNVKLQLTLDRFIINAGGELSNAEFEMEKGSDSILEMDILPQKDSMTEQSTPVLATYNGDYLSEIFRAGSTASEVATLEWSSNRPIKIQFELPQPGRLVYFLAPTALPE